VSAVDLAYEWEAHALTGPTGDSSQMLLTLSSLEALEAALSKKRAAAQHSSALSSVSRHAVSILLVRLPPSRDQLSTLLCQPYPSWKALSLNILHMCIYALQRKLTTPLPPRSATAFNSNSLPASEKDLRKRCAASAGSMRSIDGPAHHAHRLFSIEEFQSMRPHVILH
jgi:hypothetical protein